MRGPRMTKKQKVFLVNYLEQNKDLVFYNSGNKPEMEKELKWRELARGLNSAGLGPSKTTTQWKDTYKDFRTSIRRKNKELQIKSNPDLKASNTELRFMRLMKLNTPANNLGHRYSAQSSPKVIEEDENLSYVKLEDAALETVDDNDDPMSDDDPLIHHRSEIGESDKNGIGKTSKKKHDNMSHKEFIEWQRSKIQERLSFNSNASLAVEIENHALQIQKLSSSYDKHADALTHLAKSFDKVASAMDNIADKMLNYFQR